MSAQSHQLYDVVHLVKPNKQEVALYVALHTPLILAVKHVWEVVGRYRLFACKHVNHFSKCC